MNGNHKEQNENKTEVRQEFGPKIVRLGNGIWANVGLGMLGNGN